VVSKLQEADTWLILKWSKFVAFVFLSSRKRKSHSLWCENIRIHRKMGVNLRDTNCRRQLMRETWLRSKAVGLSSVNRWLVSGGSFWPPDNTSYMFSSKNNRWLVSGGWCWSRPHSNMAVSPLSLSLSKIEWTYGFMK